MSVDKQKNILISGANGMIGSALRQSLTERGFQVFPLSRSEKSADFYFDQAKQEMHFNEDIPLYGVINLAGENISDKRWNPKRKQEIISSRETTTKVLSEKLASMAVKPSVFLSASAIGFYGPTSQHHATEATPAGDDFLAEVSRRWEDATLPASSAGIRTIQMRFGIVLSVQGGVLQNFLLPGRIAVVGPIGNGKQLISWISILDVVRLTELCLSDESINGPINFVSNDPVSSQEFAMTLSKAAARPQLPALPAFMAKLMFGEMAEAALLASSDVRSARYDSIDFQLQYPELRPALTRLLESDRP